MCECICMGFKKESPIFISSGDREKTRDEDRIMNAHDLISQ